MGGITIQIQTSNGHTEEFDKQKIIHSLIKETGIDEDTAKKIARRVKDKVDRLDDVVITGRLIRGLVENDLLKNGLSDVYLKYTRIGVPIADIERLMAASGDIAHENANLDAENQEATHKHLADIVCKEYMSIKLPSELYSLHADGSLHIHDAEYFFTRQFCLDSDLRFIFYYGLLPDGKGINLPAARAARSAEVAFLHAAKALGASQCNCAGGQGYQAFNIFIAPYLEGMSYEQIKQLAQMFVFELGQMTVARGGQAVFSSIQLYPGVPAIWRDKPVVYKGQVHHDKCYEGFERETRLLFQAFMEIYLEGDSHGRPFSFPKPEVVIAREFLESDKYKVSLSKSYNAEYIKGESVSVPADAKDHGWYFTVKHEQIVAPSYRDLYRLAYKVSLKNGGIYYESQYNNPNPGKSISCVQCCAYSFAIDEDSDKDFTKMLNFEDGHHFSLGSMQVVSLNLPRAAYKALQIMKIVNPTSNTFTLSLEYLKQLIDSCIEIFKIKRSAIEKQASPFVKQQPLDSNDSSKVAPIYCDHSKLSYVIGLVGLNEYVQAMTGKQLHESSEAVDLGIKLLAALNLYVGRKAHEAGMTIALARTPAETTAQRFAVSDLIHYKEYAERYVKGNVTEALRCIDQTKDLPVEYSNGTHCAVDAAISIQEKARIEGQFFDILKGGNIFHIFLHEVSPFLTVDTVVTEDLERISKSGTSAEQYDIDTIEDFVTRLIKDTSITYFKFSKDMTICKRCNHVEAGIHETCNSCGSEMVDHIALITGYMSNVESWNAAKRTELVERHRYDVRQLG